jgi:hypothetical protein
MTESNAVVRRAAGAALALVLASPGRTYSFYVTATDPSLNQSGRSNTVTVTTP